MKDIIVHLDREQTREEHRKMLTNHMYVLFHDRLEQLSKDKKTALSPVEVFLSAECFAGLLLALPEEGIDDELDDLEEEAEGENDAMIISLLAAYIISALSSSHPAFDRQFAVEHILARWEERELLWSMLQAAAGKEEARWMEGKKTDLRTCELKESLENDNLDDDKAKDVVSNIVDICEGLTAETVEKNLIPLMEVNRKFGHAFDEHINRLEEILKKKTTPQTTQVNVGPGGTNIQNVEHYH